MAKKSRRRRWVKLWTYESLTGTLRRELTPDERSIWWDFLALAGESPEPGYICLYPDIAFTEDQLCKMLNVTSELLSRAKRRLIDTGRIKVNSSNGIIHILKWEEYQSEYDRAEYMKEYMAKYRKAKSKPNGKHVNGKLLTVNPNQGEGEEEGEKESSSTAAIFTWEQAAGRPITGFEGQQLTAFIEHYTDQWVADAIREAAQVGKDKVKLRYVERILERWADEGKNNIAAAKPREEWL